MSRNIINVHEIDNFVYSLFPSTRHKNVQVWLKTVLRKWIIKNYDKEFNTYELKSNVILKKSNTGNILERMTESEFCSFFPKWAFEAAKREVLVELVLKNDFFVEVANIVDYLNSLSQEPVFKRLSRLNFEDASHKSLVWHRSVLKIDKNNIDVGDAILLEAFQDNYKIVELTTRDLLLREGSLMRHCIGGYDFHDDTNYLSLWDAKNQPHATMEIRNNEVVQLAGKGNRMPAEKYMKFIRSFISEWELTINMSKYSRAAPNLFIRAGRQIYQVPTFEDFVNIVSYDSLHSIAFSDSIEWFFNYCSKDTPGLGLFLRKLRAVAKPHRVHSKQLGGFDNISFNEIVMPLGYFTILGFLDQKTYKKEITVYADRVLSEVIKLDAVWLYKAGDSHSSLRHPEYSYISRKQAEEKFNVFKIRKPGIFETHTGVVNAVQSKRPLYDLLHCFFGQIGNIRDQKWERLRKKFPNKQHMKELNRAYSSGKIF